MWREYFEYAGTAFAVVNGLIAIVIAVKPDHVPIARPRSSAQNEELINAKLPGTSKAPPTP